MDTLMPEHGVRYGQSMTSTEVQQQNTTLIEIRGGGVPPSHPLPGLTVIAHVSLSLAPYCSNMTVHQCTKQGP